MEGTGDSATETSESDVEGEAAPQQQSVGKSTTREIQLDGFHARGVAVIHTRTVVVLVTCTRCDTHIEASLVPNRESALACTKCSFPMSALLTPSLIHEQSPVAGRLTLSGCAPFELVVGRCSFSIDVCRIFISYLHAPMRCLRCFGSHSINSASIAILRRPSSSYRAR